MEWLRWMGVYYSIRGGHLRLILFQYSMFNGMDTGSRRCDQYAVLSVQFENDLSCNSNRDRRLVDIFGKVFLVINAASCNDVGFW